MWSEKYKFIRIFDIKIVISLKSNRLLVEEFQTWYDNWEMMREFSSISEMENIFLFLKYCEFHPILKRSVIICTYDYSTNNLQFREDIQHITSC